MIVFEQINADDNDEENSRRTFLEINGKLARVVR